MKRVLYVNHKARKCGVYEFGFGIGKQLGKSKKYEVRYSECDSLEEFDKIYREFRPHIVVYNYHPFTMPWIEQRTLLRYPRTYDIDAIQIGAIHEVYQEFADAATNVMFDYHVAADPTLLLKNPLVFKTGRLVPDPPDVPGSDSPIPSFGSFGFATGGKAFERIVDAVQAEFDEAVVNINISFSTFLDEDGQKARGTASKLAARVAKPGIKLNVTHDHLSISDLQKFLARNSINLFLYDYQEKRGISSTVDWALSSGRPLAITKSSMFRHLFPCFPSICVEDNSLSEILVNGVTPVQKYRVAWSPENLLWDYERIFSTVLSKGRHSKWFKFKRWYKSKIRKHPIKASWESYWLKAEDNYVFDGFVKDTYIPVSAGAIRYNRLLDNDALELYKETIKFMTLCCPAVMAKKIPEANVQQAFVFDTAYRLAKSRKADANILAIGAFEDTASMTLKKLGFQIEEIDTVINWDLQEFRSIPKKLVDAYDLVISTSVIEHVQDDEQFITDIFQLLKVGGTGILTCDFNDRYKPGDDIPEVDFRFYTQNDLKNRLLAKLPGCELIDEPDWEANHYDFTFLGRYNYSFASFVFRRIA